MESKPSRAKARISSRWSQGFLARLRRSTRWALVSLSSGIGASSLDSLSSKGPASKGGPYKSESDLRGPPEGGRYKSKSEPGRRHKAAPTKTKRTEKQKAHVPVIWHVGFETWTSITA